MTVTREYRCDLCHNRIGDDHCGIGIVWHGRQIGMETLAMTEHHLCNNCRDALREILGPKPPAEASRSWAGGG